MVKLDPALLDRIRRSNPDFDRDHALIEAVARDCAIAYFWNPYVSSEEFAYLGWSTTLYAGIDDATRTAYVVFRGTDQLLDWLVNCACLPLPLGHPLAHGGFVAAWMLARRRFLPWLREQAPRFDRIVIGGHSLGGALALACAYDLRCAGFDVERCITVGAPRVYTAWSVAKVEKVLADRLIRVCREQDFVPKVPPAFLGFRHVGSPWVYLAEVLGEREPEPFPVVGRWLGKAWYYFRWGRVGELLEQYGVASNVQTQLTIYLLSLVGGVGAAATLLVQLSVASLLGASFLFVIVSGALIALQAHRSGHYAATRAAASLVEEWQIHHLRQLAAGRELEPAGEGKVRIDLSVTIRATHDDDHKRRLVRNFRRFFGAATFQTVLGQCLEDAIRSSDEPAGAAPPGAWDARTLDQHLKRTCMSLLLYGYSSEEIDQMLDTGIIARPRRWSRYYATVDATPAREAPSGSTVTSASGTEAHAAAAMQRAR